MEKILRARILKSVSIAFFATGILSSASVLYNENSVALTDDTLGEGNMQVHKNSFSSLKGE
jgi:hypothetical protein